LNGLNYITRTLFFTDERRAVELRLPARPLNFFYLA